MKLNLMLLTALAILTGACSNSAQITGNVDCPSLEKNTFSPTVSIFAEPDSNATVVEKLPVESVVRVYDYRNHERNPKLFVRIKTSKNEGWVSPSCLLVNQDPEKSVFKWAYKKDYKPFNSPEDLDHYNNGYEFEELKNLPKEKVPLAELAPELQGK
ncbi:hypothetical protein CH373_17795 [Leptospira perolatii]|uniref:SH3b domain-containing protein n=1 Tax=Leptospira perolatii TaxID=2023191 RepID=A0A2M9ZI98_9LEPT|nr:SH3 domain-containing protein [Leptospira perolatii]PJZ68232.1 hypothetical protein CH360_17370 [Leptospira perolatii]PJZ71779.1 hypothetical protein CH373_17795 [Leptospira perolatii]